ncbi:glycosyltransferase family 39 protein [Paenibacillus eucommiae]|uniref:Glycosyltransferase RgtA/B/C/D-like domain-containing protein n=1 Tax=Paenibacillus eucommiae TaxID=1355755 RepID=A0ABS4IP09_9BACL|nr:glycosyltransferase family 39 protein [Paenibacillus eucommiae]MBP1988661.1 hypothetical protein [Paenibacillus eucommiae]
MDNNQLRTEIMEFHEKPKRLIYFVIWLGILFYSSIAIMAAIRTGWITGSILLMAVSLIATTASFAVIIYVIQKYLTRKWFVLLLLVTSLGLRIIWAVGIDTPITSDFSVMYQSAVQGASGDYSFANSEYYVRWGYQLGFALYESLILTLFGNHVLVLECLNCVYQTITVYLVYRMAAILFGEFGGRIAGIFYALYVPNILLCSILSNQHLSILFFVLGCYLGIKYRTNRRSYAVMAVALCFGLGHIIRPVGSVYLMCFIAFLVISEWRASGLAWSRFWILTRKLISLIAVYFLFLQAVNLALIGSGISDLPLGSREPYWKFMVGLNAESHGFWSDADARYVVQYSIGEERNQAELALIKERIENPVKLTWLFIRKFAIMWGGEDAAASWSLEGLNLPGWERVLTIIERCQYIVIAVCGTLTLLQLLRNQRSKEKKEYEGLPSTLILPLLLLFCYASLHLFIEIQIRYRLDIMPHFIVLAGAGGRYLMVNWWKKSSQENHQAKKQSQGG